MLQASQRRRFEVDLLRMLRTARDLNSMRWPSSAWVASKAMRAMPVGWGRMGKRVFWVDSIFAICSPIDDDISPAGWGCQVKILGRIRSCLTNALARSSAGKRTYPRAEAPALRFYVRNPRLKP